MKLALVCPYDFAYPGGVANHITALDRNFVRMGHEVRVIAPASEPVSMFGDRFIPIGRPWPCPSGGSVARITLSPWLSSQVKAVLGQEKFDVIHLHEPLCPSLCTTVLRVSDTANVGTFHAVDCRAYSFCWPLSVTVPKRWLARLQVRIAVSRAAKEFISKYFAGDYTIIPNGVDLEHFSSDVAPLDQFNDGKINILFVGRLEKRKGLNYLLNAYWQVKQQIHDCRLIIVGPGTRWSNKLQCEARQRGLSDVVFAGYVPDSELPRYYKVADIACFPATGRESFGIVLLEAMAVGKPVVASNIEGYADLLTNGVEGLLVPPADQKALAQALVSLTRERRLRAEMGMRGRTKASEYAWANIARRVMECYTKALGGHW
jgi:phosphatidylinositol alpha-mannosyltransferase